MRGVIAAGHPLSAAAGADVLRSGGNAVDAAVAAVLTSFVAESVLTGHGAGGFMLVHTPAGERVLLDFFVAAPGAGRVAEPASLLPIDVHFTDTITQEFHVGVSSCGVYGTSAGLAAALDRFGSLPLADLSAGAARLAREGVEIAPLQEYLLDILSPILTSTPEAADLYEPEGRPLRAGERLFQPELAELLDRLGAEGPDFLYRGDVARAVAEWVGERGGLLTATDLESYEVIDRVPTEVRYGGRVVLTNPPPSSGGILIANSLALLERLPGPIGVEALVEVMARTDAVRDGEFGEGLHSAGFAEQLLAPGALDAAAGLVASRLGSTTHVSVLDEQGGCASVTCSNGSSSGVVVPGTGLHLNNMLGEADLNPAGWHAHPAGRRIPSMMAPTIVLSDGRPEAVLGSAGSNRIRSAILQMVLGVVDLGLGARAAVDRPRVHWERGAVDAEPGVDPAALERIEAAGYPVRRWSERNLFFGGVQAAVRDTADGTLSGAGDPRRGGAAIVVT